MYICVEFVLTLQLGLVAWTSGPGLSVLGQKSQLVRQTGGSLAATEIVNDTTVHDNTNYYGYKYLPNLPCQVYALLNIQCVTSRVQDS